MLRLWRCTLRGRSKEKCSDCPLVTLAVVLDGSGFVRRSRVFPGNASEPQTLEDMLTDLAAPKGATVAMDAGIATEANLVWLRAHDYHYVVVSRKRERQFDPEMASEVQSAGDVTIKIHRVFDANNAEAHLYCHSPAREQKDRAIDDAKGNRFEAALQKLAEGLAKPSGAKAMSKVMEQIGRAKQRYARAAQHYHIDVVPDESGENAAAITWKKQVKQGSAAMYPGVYCLRTTLIDLRPVYHPVERRVERHLFISVLAYHFVHALRLQLKAKGVDDAWDTLRETLAGQQRITTTLQRRDGRTVHVRKATRPEPHQQKILEILGLRPNPGDTHRTVI